MLENNVKFKFIPAEQQLAPRSALDHAPTGPHRAVLRVDAAPRPRPDGRRHVDRQEQGQGLRRQPPIDHVRRHRRIRRREAGDHRSGRLPADAPSASTRSVHAYRRGYCSSVLPAPARPCSPELLPEKRASASSASPAPTSWRCSSVSAPAASATSSSKPSAWATAIIFVDEIDSIGRKRGAGMGGGHDEREQTLNQMLAEMDGFEATEGIVILAATNRPDVLDPALLRPGRFDRQIIVPLPEFTERRAILEVHSRDKQMGPDVDMDTMAQATPGMSGADLANLVNEAALVAVRRNSKQIERIDFENARDRVMLGARRESMILSAEEKKATAFHEGGHALLATVLPPWRPAPQGHDPASRDGPRCHLVAAARASHVLQGILRRHDLQGNGWTSRRDDRVRSPQLRRGQRPRAGHWYRSPNGPRVGHERSCRPRRPGAVNRPRSWATTSCRRAASTPTTRPS